MHIRHFDYMRKIKRSLAASSDGESVVLRSIAATLSLTFRLRSGLLLRNDSVALLGKLPQAYM
jgi:hypothetical protein